MYIDTLFKFGRFVCEYAYFGPSIHPNFFWFHIMVNKKHGKQNQKKACNLQKAFFSTHN